MRNNKMYSPEIRSFALTLHFYSPKAYNYVRKTWSYLLPHPSTLRKWYTVVDANPGFTLEAFETMAAKSARKQVVINLVIDEMSIREKIIFSQGCFHGGVDLGTVRESQDNDNVSPAKNALVFMAVSLNENWKIPIGYFLIKSLCGTERANLLTKAFQLLNNYKIKVFSVTFDGAPCNISMCNKLGANFNYGPNFSPFFKNPVTGETCFVFLDLCHMIKLIRNCLGDKKLLKYGNNKIMWQYIVDLHKLQEKEGLRIANKLTDKHIYYHNNRMNVKLSMQTLSESVYISLKFLLTVSNIEIKNTFSGCYETALFCYNINNAGDILNSKNKFSKNKFNIPLNEQNYKFLKDNSLYLENYIRNLKDGDNQPILNSNRKVGFMGLIANLQNIFKLYEVLKNNGLPYLLTYKLSQDYLETFFSAIRSRGGYNNNPDVLQFRSAYKRLLVRHELKEFDTGNCLLDNVDILHVSSGTKVNNTDSKNLSLFPEEKLHFWHDYVSSFWQLNAVIENISNYIAGFVTKLCIKKIDCILCKSFLIGDSVNMPLLTRMRNKGSFLTPSRDVFYICNIAESVIRQNNNRLFRQNIKDLLINQIFSLTGKLFNTDAMTDHIKSQDILNNHRVQICKLIASVYIDVRLHHEGKKLTSRREFIRSKYTKLILFKNQ